jgi:FtsH-binding integral membrane protein
MFLGHFAVGFGAKAAKPSVSLGTLFIAAQFADLLWPTLLLLGLEHVEIDSGITRVTPLDFTSYPISHSLLMLCLWGLVFGLLYWLIRKSSRGALVLGLLIVSHWVLDLIVHRPDLPLYPGSSPRLGMGLWNSLAGTFLAEGVVFVIGLGLYLRVTRAKNRAGFYGFWVLVGFLILIYVSNVLGPLPPSTTAIAWVGQLQWVLVGWAYWIDRNRVVHVPVKND